ncbi:MAG: sulfurtransferase complex subunit TusB [Methylovulum sp.]|uniref:sulfurtransferase complex subunit TusB n=1 Tax=Methylovulum sp. TaxID=1916980 RepID=UPI0026392C5A|nr:sulfurtransferase complex subunit TusB [Methylovulum sp.]MDD2724698.1 sulfurtransferase complex subunit TusB [Methylovulum sp.]MDD5126387.1 sulfurtransferase complex subunit TusB [Methylovulum sp.]
MLHLIFQSPLECAVLERVTAGDDVVFLDSAVLGLLKNSRWAEHLELLAQSCQLFALVDELKVRGIAEERLAAGLTVLDYAGLVALTVKNTAIQSWS